MTIRSIKLGTNAQQLRWEYADFGTLYACENDNPRRSGYLWEICTL